MRVLIVTDAWYPQVNGVVRTLTAMRDMLTRFGDDVKLLTPEGFHSLPCPTYPEIRLALVTPRMVAREIRRFMPCAIHIATEGPLGFATRHVCRNYKLPFTTAFHTRFPEYIHARFRIPVDCGYRVLRWFHRDASVVMAPTPSVVDNLRHRGFSRVQLWGRGVDTGLFKPGVKAEINACGPVLLYVGRVAIEKNITDFLNLKVQGKKVVVGDGPMLPALKKRFPDVLFVGAQHGEKLVSYYNAADVFVFPSRTDTFGLVMLEALACGVPVAAYPVMGPKDVITEPGVGVLDQDLSKAVGQALQLERNCAREFAERRAWSASAETFRSYLDVFDPARIDRVALA